MDEFKRMTIQIQESSFKPAENYRRPFLAVYSFNNILSEEYRHLVSSSNEHTIKTWILNSGHCMHTR